MPPRLLPESCSGLTHLFDGTLVSIDDWRCAGHDTPGRNEEWSRDDRIVVTRRGVWELEIAGASRRADPVTALFWNSNGAYRVRHPVTGGDRCTVFRLTPAGSLALRELSPIRGRREASGTFPTRPQPLDGPAYLLHRRALQRARRDQGAADPLAIEEPALEFLRLVSAGAAGCGEADAARVTRPVGRARDLIARDFRKPLAVSDVAREAGISPFHLSRLFRKATGVSLYRTVVRLRLREGLERLLDEPLSLSQIALDVGFASHSHFTDAFRAEYGCPPTEVRRGFRALRSQGPIRSTRLRTK